MKIKYKDNDTGAFYSVSVLIIVAIVIAVAVVIMTIYMGLFGGSDQNNSPLVSIKQETSYILVTSVHNGPVHISDTYAQIINKNTGEPEGNATINDNNDGQLDTGDTISITGISQGSFTIEILYREEIVGHCQFNIF